MSQHLDDLEAKSIYIIREAYARINPMGMLWSIGKDSTAMLWLVRKAFFGRVRVSFGWGTLLTNDFRGLTKGDALAPFSLVCKAVSANGRPTVKLSDNPNKAMGPGLEIERYKRVFDVGRQSALEVVV